MSKSPHLAPNLGCCHRVATQTRLLMPSSRCHRQHLPNFSRKLFAPRGDFEISAAGLLVACGPEKALFCKCHPGSLNCDTQQVNPVGGSKGAAEETLASCYWLLYATCMLVEHDPAATQLLLLLRQRSLWGGVYEQPESVL